MPCPLHFFFGAVAHQPTKLTKNSITIETQLSLGAKPVAPFPLCLLWLCSDIRG